jgi:heme exporter protein D
MGNIFISYGIFFTIPIAGLYLWVPIGLSVIYVAFMVMILVLVIFTASVIAKTK